MSRVGKRPVLIPEGVKCTITGQEVQATGREGSSSLTLPLGVEAKLSESQISVAVDAKVKNHAALWGLGRNLLQNLLDGVARGFKVLLEIEGVGYRANVQGNTLKLQLGFSHDVQMSVPEGLKVVSDKPTALTISGVDRQKVGQFAANIQKLRPPEPYKGKGIRKAGQFILRKEGKKK